MHFVDRIHQHRDSACDHRIAVSLRNHLCLFFFAGIIHAGQDHQIACREREASCETGAAVLVARQLFRREPDFCQERPYHEQVFGHFFDNFFRKSSSEHEREIVRNRL